MEKLAQLDAAKVIDVLSERLAFERAGVKRYDRVQKEQTLPSSTPMDILPGH